MDNNQKNDLPSFEKKQDFEKHTLLKNDDCSIQYGTISREEENVALIRTDSVEQSKCMKLYGVLITFTIEPAIFFFILAYLMNATILANMMMDKGCLYHLNYSSEVCRNLSHYDADKKNVEILATNYSLYSNLTSFIAVLMMIFIAPWSDKYGRRIPLLISVAGAIFTDIGYILCTVYFDSKLIYLVLAKLPNDLTGGFICMLTIVFSHASEVSSEKNRTLKYTSIEACLGFGFAIGGVTGGFLYRYYGYLYVYITVAMFHLFCFMWILFFVEETTGLDIDMKWQEKARDFFSFKNFKDSFNSTFRKREGNIRVLIVLLLASMCMIVLNYEAYASIAYMYVHHVYNWDPADYSIVSTSSWTAGIVVTFTATAILNKVFKCRDLTLGIIGTASMFGKTLILAFSKYHPYIYYAGQFVGVFFPMGSLAIRTVMSKIVDKQEIGRVFSFLATCETVVPLLGSIAISQMFNATIDIYPNIPYIVGSTLLILPLVIFIWARKMFTNV